MALRAVPEHPKFAHFQSILGIEKFEALGILESIWHFTGRFAPQGNIGKYNNQTIARWVGWKSDPEVLIGALTEAGWLDNNEPHRIVTHDWHEHADHATRLSLKRSKTSFCRSVGPTPDIQSQQTADIVLPVEGLPGAGAGAGAGAVSTPAKKKPSPDPRAGEFKSAFQDAFHVANQVPAPWDAKEATNLARFLKANPTITIEQWRRILYHRAQSPINQKASLSRWIAQALSWLDAEADEWGKPLGAGKRSAPAASVPKRLSADELRAREKADEENERESYRMWLGMNAEYRAKNPWRGRVFEEVA